MRRSFMLACFVFLLLSSGSSFGLKNQLDLGNSVERPCILCDGDINESNKTNLSQIKHVGDDIERIKPDFLIQDIKYKDGKLILDIYGSNYRDIKNLELYIEIPKMGYDETFEVTDLDFSINFKEDIAGKVKVIVVVDPENKIIEENENNNEFIKFISFGKKSVVLKELIEDIERNERLERSIEDPEPIFFDGESMTQNYYYLSGNLESKSSEGVTYYFINDLISPRYVIDDSGELVYESLHDVFGNNLFIQGKNKGGFSNKEMDTSNTYYFNARNYDPENGRFIAVDPILGENSYSYASNNPVTLLDVDGKKSHSANDAFNPLYTDYKLINRQSSYKESYVVGSSSNPLFLGIQVALNLYDNVNNHRYNMKQSNRINIDSWNGYWKAHRIFVPSAIGEESSGNGRSFSVKSTNRINVDVDGALYGMSSIQSSDEGDFKAFQAIVGFDFVAGNIYFRNIQEGPLNEGQRNRFMKIYDRIFGYPIYYIGPYEPIDSMNDLAKREYNLRLNGDYLLDTTD